jgi:RES domain-containing protein
MRVVWRLCAARHARTAFSGEGARLFGGRWNDRGVPLVYTSSTLALAVVETLVHVAEVPLDFVAIRVEIPGSVRVERLASRRLPRDWRSHPASTRLQRIGTDWARSGRSLALEVPSAVIPEERNVLINPLHPQLGLLIVHKPTHFAFDRRSKDRP